MKIGGRSLLEHLLFNCWDIIILPCYLNAYIYLVKGGRLGLSPSVLFHSCRPSFRHIGVMFPVRSLRGWVIMGTPWYFALIKAFPAMPNIGFTICHLAFSFPLGVALLRVIIILPPRASAPLSVGPN